MIADADNECDKDRGFAKCLSQITWSMMLKLS